MNKPNAEEFAHQVLHSLAALSAEMELNRKLLCDVLAHLEKIPAREIRTRYVAETMKRTDEIYAEACAAVNLDPSK